MCAVKPPKPRPASRRGNPLAWALGRYIKAKRQPEYSKSQALAAALKLEPASFRLVESGGAILQPRHSRDLVRALTHRHIAWPRLATLMAAARIAQDEIKAGDGAKNTLQWFASVEPAAAPLVRLLLDSYPPPTSPVRLREIQQRVADATGEYLSRPVDHRPSGLGEKLENLIATLDPLHLDGHLRLAVEFSLLRPVISASQLDKWEKLNADRLHRVIGIVLRPVARKEWEAFDWPFLRANRRTPCTLFLSRGYPQRDVPVLESLLRDKAGISKANSRGRKYLSPVTVHQLSAEEEARLTTVLGELQLPEANLNYWIYEVGFGLPGSEVLPTLPIAMREGPSLNPDNSDKTCSACDVGQSHRLHEALLSLTGERQP